MEKEIKNEEVVNEVQEEVKQEEKVEEVKLNVYQKISKIMSEIEYLKKDDKVITNQKTGAGYNAITEEKVTTAVRNAMVKYGIVIIPIEQEHKREDEILKDYQGNEKVSRLTTVDTKYRIQNIDDKDDYVIAVSSGTGADTQDKGIGKAMTYSYKYLLLRTFAIPTGEDTDKISSEVYDSQFNRNEINEIKEKIKNYGTKASAKLKEMGKRLSELTEEELRILLNDLYEEETKWMRG